MYCSFYATTFQTVICTHVAATLNPILERVQTPAFPAFGTFQDVLMIDNYVEHTVCIKRHFCALILQQLNGTVGNCCGGGAKEPGQVRSFMYNIYVK